MKSPYPGTIDVNCYDQAKELALKQGWLTVSLIQHKFRLRYGYALSLIDMLQHKGIIDVADDTGKRRLISSQPEEGKPMQTPDTGLIEARNLQSLMTSIEANTSAMQQAKKRLAKAFAPDFRIFDFMRQDETGLSLCVAQLLDSNGRHGQDSVYLDLFIKMFAQHISWLSTAKTRPAR